MTKSLSQTYAKGRTLSVRVTAQQLADLSMFAEVDGVAVAEQMRRAVDLLLKERRADPEFRKRVEAAMARGAALLRELDEPKMAKILTRKSRG